MKYIFIVDDVVIVCLYEWVIFEEVGYIVCEVSNGLEVLEMVLVVCVEGQQFFDLYVVDVNML